NTAKLTILNSNAGADFIVNGTLYDRGSSGNGVSLPSGATWVISSIGTVIKSNGSSATVYRDNYEGGMVAIPSTATWIYRYNGDNTYVNTATTNMFYPNLYFESTNGSYSFNDFRAALTGASPATVKGSMYVGTTGTGTVAVYNSNIALTPMLINGSLTVGLGSTLTNASYNGTTTSSYGPGTGFEILGDLTVNGTLNARYNDTGLIKISGNTNQIISGSGTIITQDLTIANSSPVNIMLNANIPVYGVLKFGANSKLTFNTGDITMKSLATGTAMVDVVPTSANILYNSGKLVVERYIKTPRKWQLLSVPTSSAQSVKTAWMENKTNIPGYGTFVTDSISDWSSPSKGFDAFSIGGPSVKALDITTNIWKGIANVDVPLTGSTSYLVFVRGDRQVTPPSAANSTTTLRTSGQLQRNDQVRTLPNAGFAMVGNPYPSAVDIFNVTKTNLAQSGLYYWDPLLTGFYGVGAYQTLAYNALGYYDLVPGGSGSYGSTIKTLESGQAFFVRTNAGGVVTFKESDKIISSRTVTFVESQPHTLRANLFLNSSPGNRKLADGNMAFFDDAYSNNIDFDDAIKLTNSGENVSFKREEKLLSVERRQSITGRDTLFLNITRLAASAYQWEVPTVNLDAPGRRGFLVDNYLHLSTELNLSGNNIIDFVVDANAGSAAADRFMIVFSSSAPVPIADPNITLTTARQQNQSVLVSWSTLNEAPLTRYEVERSSNGSSFTSLATLPALHANQPAYEFVDANRQPLDAYYRIKGTGQNGLIVYSNVFKIAGIRHSNDISIYPNPVENRVAHVTFAKMPAGIYQVSLYNIAGIMVYNTETTVSGKDEMKSFVLPPTLSSGSYQLSFYSAGIDIKTLKLIVP
ncbi:MAG: T9SS type A sorting domain-containing protein, partial [Ferruginibacter sp.]